MSLVQGQSPIPLRQLSETLLCPPCQPLRFPEVKVLFQKDELHPTEKYGFSKIRVIRQFKLECPEQSAFSIGQLPHCGAAFLITAVLTELGAKDGLPEDNYEASTTLAELPRLP